MINMVKKQVGLQIVLYTFIFFILMRFIKGNKVVQYYFSKGMGFTEPANDTMYSIILLLSEMTILLSFIFLAVFFTLMCIINLFNWETNPYPRHFEKTVESTLDVLFVIFPTIIIIYILIPSLGFIFNNETLVQTVFNLDIIGHQWYWSYEYSLFIGVSLYDIFLDDLSIVYKLEFDSLLDVEATNNRLLTVDKRVVIPVNTLIQATITSQDVIHSWSVPQLGIKYDAIPGRLVNFVLNSNVLGIFYGQCSELRGVNHAFMPICVQAVETDIFLDWILISMNVNPSGIILNKVNIDLDVLNLLKN
jgi:cytochrome c oxidase subunit 2